MSNMFDEFIEKVFIPVVIKKERPMADKYTVKINSVKLVPSQWGGQDLLIKMLTLQKPDGSYVKHIKLDELAVDILQGAEIETDKIDEKTQQKDLAEVG